MITLIKGFHDILPQDARKWDFLIRTASTTLERFGFRQIVVPIMEKTELFVRGIGQVTDIVEKEMYTFEDHGGETLTLRPEATAGILRSVVEHSLLKKEPLLKLYTIGPMFRRERPSKGRFRQFFQIDAEVLGDDSPYTDTETILAAHAVMTNIGAAGLIMEINSVGCVNCRAEYRSRLRGYFEEFLAEMCPDCQRRFHSNPLRILDCKVDRCIELAQGARPLYPTHWTSLAVTTSMPCKTPWHSSGSLAGPNHAWSAGSTTIPGQRSRSFTRSWAVPRLSAAADDTITWSRNSADRTSRVSALP